MKTLVAQAATRVPELVPVRHGRMLVSPLTPYRGGATIMAAELARTPRVHPVRAMRHRREPV